MGAAPAGYGGEGEAGPGEFGFVAVDGGDGVGGALGERPAEGIDGQGQFDGALFVQGDGGGFVAHGGLDAGDEGGDGGQRRHGCDEVGVAGHAGFDGVAEIDGFGGVAVLEVQFNLGHSFSFPLLEARGRLILGTGRS